MQVGSLVETVSDFEDVRSQWGLDYPKKGTILTISFIEKHPVPSVAKHGIMLLYFEELPHLPGLCDKTIYGNPNFIELMPLIDTSIFAELFNEPVTV